MTCPFQYSYDDTACALAAGHPDPDHHVSADGFHWLHHEDLIAVAGDGDLTDDLYEIWDEPIDRLNGPRPASGPQVINQIGIFRP